MADRSLYLPSEKCQRPRQQQQTNSERRPMKKEKRRPAPRKRAKLESERLFSDEEQQQQQRRSLSCEFCGFIKRPLMRDFRERSRSLAQVNRLVLTSLQSLFLSPATPVLVPYNLDSAQIAFYARAYSREREVEKERGRRYIRTCAGFLRER